MASVLKPWATGAQRSDLGVGQNRALLFSVSREGGSNVSGLSFGGQPMTLVAQRTQNNLSVETYVLNEAGLALASGNTVTPTFTGGAPFNVKFASIVLENVDQALLVTDSGVAGNGGANTLNTNFAVDNGGISVLAGAHSAGNRTGSMGTAGWSVGISNGVGAFSFATGYHQNTAAGNDVARINFTGGNGRMVLNGAYLELAPPTEPANLNFSSKSDTQVNLTWDSGFGTTNNFFVAYQENTAPADCSSGTVVPFGNVQSGSITGLTPNKTYGFKL